MTELLPVFVRVRLPAVRLVMWRACSSFGADPGEITISNRGDQRGLSPLATLEQPLLEKRNPSAASVRPTANASDQEWPEPARRRAHQQGRRCVERSSCVLDRVGGEGSLAGSCGGRVHVHHDEDPTTALHHYQNSTSGSESLRPWIMGTPAGCRLSRLPI